MSRIQHRLRAAGVGCAGVIVAIGLVAGCDRQGIPRAGVDGFGAAVQTEVPTARLNALAAWAEGQSEAGLMAALDRLESLPAARREEASAVIRVRLGELRGTGSVTPVAPPSVSAGAIPGAADSGVQPKTRAMRFRTEVMGLVGTSPESALERLGALKRRTAEVQALEREVLLAVAGAQGPERALELFAKFPGIRIQEFYPALAEAWALRDPAGALRWASGLPQSTRNDWHVSKVLGVWAGSDPKAALDAVAALEPGPRTATHIRDLVANWCSNDPEAALNWVRAQQRVDPVVEFAVIESLKDPALAMRYLGASRLASPYKRTLIDSSVGRWAQADPTGTLQWVESLPRGELRALAWEKALMGVARVDPQAALRGVSGGAEELMSEEFIGSFARLIAVGEPGSLPRWAETLPAGPLRQAALNALPLGAPDPASAAALAAKLPEGAGRAAALAEAASEWFNTDPAAAKGWMRALPDPRDRLAAAGSVIVRWASTNPEEAGAFLRPLAGDEEAKPFDRLAVEWARSDVESALRWAFTLPESKCRRSVVSAIGFTEAKRSVSAAEERLAAMRPSADRNACLNGVVGCLLSVHTDPRKAADLLGRFASGDTVPPLTNQVVMTLGQRDPDALAAWVVALPPGPLREQALVRSVLQIEGVDPYAALELARRMAPGNARNNRVLQAIRNLGKSDPVAARAAVEASGLSESTRRELLETLPRSP